MTPATTLSTASTAASPSSGQPPRTDSTGRPRSQQGLGTPADALEAFVFGRIAEAQSALWRAELVRRVLAALIVSMAVLLAWWIVDQWIWSPPVIARTLVAVGLFAAGTFYATKRLWPIVHYRITEDYAARSLERDHPELGHSLSSYIGLRRQPPGGNSVGLADRVVQSVGAEAARKLRRIDAPPSEATGLASWWAATIGLLAMLAVYSVASPKSIVQSTARIFQPLAALDAPQRVQISNVQPGDAEVLAGRDLMIAATVKNLRDEEPIKLVWESGFESPQGEQTQEGSDDQQGSSDQQGSNDKAGLFAADPEGPRDRFTASIRIPHQASGIQRYRIEAGDASAGPFELTIRDTPVVRVAEVQYEPPAYTGQKTRTRRIGSISGIDGTRVRVIAETNRPISRAVLELNPRLVGQEIRATAGASEMKLAPDGRRAEHEFVLRAQTGNGAIVLEDYRIRIWDDADQNNADPVIHPIEIIKDLPPEVRIVIPQTSPRDVPIDAQQVFEIHASDVDFGLAEVEIEVRRGIDVIARSSLWKAPEDESRALGNRVVEYRFRPSRMIVAGGRNGGGLNVGDEVEVTAIATDNRTDDSDPLIVPGVTRTSPITLRIVAGAEINEEQEQPSAEKNRSQNGQSSQSGEGDAPQGQQGGGSGESGKSQKGEGQNGEQQSGQGQQDNEPDGENENGQGQEGESQSSDSQTGDSQPNEGENSGEGQPENNPPGMSDSADPGNSDPGNTDDSSDPANTPDRPQANGDSQTSKEGQSANQTAPNGDSQNEDSQNQGEQQQSPPQDDAEAFERIKEYLDKKDNQQSSNSEGNGQNQPNDQSQADDSHGQSDQRPSSQGDQTQGPKDGMNEGTDGGNQPKDGTEQDGQGQSGQPPAEPDSSGQQGDGESDAQNGQQSSSGKPSEDGQQGKGSDQAGDDQEASDDQKNGEERGPSKQESGSEQQRGGEQESDGDQSAMGKESGESDRRGQGKESGAEGASQTNPQDGSQNQADQSGESDSSESTEGEASNSPKRSDQPQTSGQRDESSDDSQSSDQADPSGASQSDSSPTDSTRSDTFPSDSSSSGGNGSSGGGTGTDTAEDEIELPDPVDMDYTKKATDMVLDYLDETRQTPDPELLERLKWTEQDLQRFRDRWKDLPTQDQESSSNTELTDEMREALQSLGMRPPGGTRRQQTDRADGLKGLRDSGNRRQAPPAIRDAFEAFRRGLSQPK